MRKSGNSPQRFAPNVSIFQKNVRANLANFIQDIFWGMGFSNENIKMIEEGLGDRQDLNLSLPGLTRVLLKVWDAGRETKRFVSASNLNELRKKVRPNTLSQGAYLA